LVIVNGLWIMGIGWSVPGSRCSGEKNRDQRIPISESRSTRHNVRSAELNSIQSKAVIMRRFLIPGLLCSALAVLLQTGGKSRNPSGPAVSVSASMKMPDVSVPSFPKRNFSIIDFGAVGDGMTLNTEAFAKAISACSRAGGGRVVVPGGLWLTGPIQMLSRVDLHLESGGSVILFSPDWRLYSLVETSYEGSGAFRRMSPISGKNIEDVAITGGGIIDGSGQAWRPVKRGKLTESQWKNLVRSGGAVDARGETWYPSAAAMNAVSVLSEARRTNRALSITDYEKMAEFLRPVLVSLTGCKNVLLDGPTFENSPAWNIHPLLCENITIRNVTVRNPWYSQNGDGLDLESCRNAVVAGCSFDVGDDAICMKSGRDRQGRERGVPTENVRIRDCVVYHGHGGFVVGSEMSGGVRNIEVSDCIFIGTDTGLRFKSTRGRGGVVENILIRNIIMKDIPAQAITFNLFYGGRAPVPEPGDEDGPAPVPGNAAVTEETPTFRNISISDVVCRGAAQAVVLQGLPEMPLLNVELKNLAITAGTGLTCTDADRILIKNVRIVPEKGPVLSFVNSRNVAIDRVTCPPGAEVFLSLSGNKTRNINLYDTDLRPAVKGVETAGDVPPNALTGGPNP
jgi:polygalacturonase